MKHKLIDTAARAAAAALLAFALGCALGRSIFLPIENYWAVGALCCLVAVVMFGYLYSLKTFAVGTVVLLIAGIVTYRVLDKEVIERLYAQFEWAALYATDNAEYDFELSKGFIYPLALVMSVVCAPLCRYRHGFVPALLLTLGSLCAEWALEHYDVLPFLWPAMAALGVLFAFSAYSARRKGAVRASAYILAVLIAVMSLTAFSVPPSTRPNVGFGRFMDDVGDLFGDYVLFTRPRYAFSIRSAGLMPLGSRLGGPVIGDDTEVLRVSAGTPQLLRATTRNHYDGHAWSDTLNQNRMLFGSPFATGDRNAVYQLNLPAGEGREDYMNTAVYTITHLVDGVSTMFAPHRPLSTEGGGLRVYFNNSGELFHTRNVLADTQYTITALVPDMGREGFGAYLDALAESDDPYYEAVCSQYMDIPDMVDERVYALAKVLTGGDVYESIRSYLPYEEAETNERMPDAISEEMLDEVLRGESSSVGIYVFENGSTEKIQRFDISGENLWLDYALRGSEYSSDISRRRRSPFFPAISQLLFEEAVFTASNYAVNGDSPYDTANALKSFLTSDIFKYTKSPAEPPEDEDFVSYFVLEDRSGYCTYYASAMTIMARMCGIPARYVEGYRLPSAKRNGEYIVTGDNAHAWTEIYLKGYGWLAIDATRGETVAASAGGGGGGPSDMLPPQPTPDPRGLEEDYEPWLGLTTQTRDYTLIIAAAACLLALALLIVFGVKRYYRAHPRHIKEPDRARAALNYYVDILYLLRCFGNCVMSGETPYDFADKVDRWFKEEPCTMRYIADVIVRMRYAGVTPTLRELDAMDAFHDILGRRARKYLGGMRFISYRMFAIPKPTHPAVLPTGPVSKTRSRRRVSRKTARAEAA